MNRWFKAVTFLTAFVSIGVLGGGGGGDAVDTASSEFVPALTTDTFQSFVEKNSLVLVEFYAPWCGHCKKLAPEFEAAAKQLSESKSEIKLAKVDATAEKDLASKFEVQGFPTLFLFRKGEPEPYKGGRTKAAIIQWLEMAAGPVMTEIADKDAVKKAIEKDAVAYVAFVKSKESSEYKMYSDIADTNRLLGKFYIVLSPSVEHATVEVHRTGEEVTKTIMDKQERVQAWCKSEAFPLFGPVNGETFGRYSERTDKWFWVAGTEADYETVGPVVRKVSKNYRDDFNFVYLDSKQYEQHAKSMGLETYPSVAIQTPEGRYVFTGDMTEKLMTKFIEAVKAGKVEKHLKSEPIPESNDAAVKVVVGRNFESMVLRSDKDVLLEVYAPWCGHCKHLQPIYEEFAESAKKSSHLTVAKMDGTANESPVQGFEFHGFPTLFFVKAGENKPIPFDGDRTVEGFKEFVKSHAKYDVLFDAAASSKDVETKASGAASDEL